MNQLSLFDDERISRKADPETSKEAARQTHKKLPATQHALLCVFRRSASALTANEAAEVATKGTKDLLASAETFRKRAHELERKGLIEIVGTRRCMITGRTASQYRACQHGE